LQKFLKKVLEFFLSFKHFTFPTTQRVVQRVGEGITQEVLDAQNGGPWDARPADVWRTVNFR
jgi:hypothetical protein